VTFRYTGFGEGTHVVQETVYEDTGAPLWNRLTQVEFTFEGDSATHKVDLEFGAGSHTIRPDAWELNATPPFVGEEPHIRGFIPPPPTTLACDAPPSRQGGTADIDCTGVTFRYTGFGAGTHVVQETVYEDTGLPLWNRLTQVEFTFEGDSATHKVDLDLGPGSHTIRPDAWQLNAPTGDDPHVRGFIPPPPTTVDCGTPPGPAPCPSGNISMRWHYATPGNPGPWSATKSTTCPSTPIFWRQAMNGDVKVSPGTPIQVGYSFKAPNGTITVAPRVAFVIRCASGARPSRPIWTIDLPTRTYNVTNGDWWPTGDRTSALSYQSGPVRIPNFCRGGRVRLDKGGVFWARLT
jgi:hypothetical protein